MPGTVVRFVEPLVAELVDDPEDRAVGAARSLQTVRIGTRYSGHLGGKPAHRVSRIEPPTSIQPVGRRHPVSSLHRRSTHYDYPVVGWGYEEMRSGRRGRGRRSAGVVHRRCRLGHVGFSPFPRHVRRRRIRPGARLLATGVLPIRRPSSRRSARSPSTWCWMATSTWARPSRCSAWAYQARSRRRWPRLNVGKEVDRGGRGLAPRRDLAAPPRSRRMSSTHGRDGCRRSAIPRTLTGGRGADVCLEVSRGSYRRPARGGAIRQRTARA